MKKLTLITLLMLSTITVSAQESFSEGPTEKIKFETTKIKNLYAKLVKIFSEYTNDIKENKTLTTAPEKSTDYLLGDEIDSLTKEKRLVFYLTPEKKSWVAVYPNTFMFDFSYKERKAYVRMLSSHQDVVDMLEVLSPILDVIVGYEDTKKILSPFFDKEASVFYFKELENKKPLIADMIMKGDAMVDNHLPTATNTNYDKGKSTYTLTFNAAANWRIFINHNNGVYGEFRSPYYTGGSGIIFYLTTGIGEPIIYKITPYGAYIAPYSMETPEFKWMKTKLSICKKNYFEHFDIDIKDKKRA